MSAINYIRDNYKKIIAVTLLAVVTSAATCFFFWPDATPVMADNTDTYGLVQDLVREEVEHYLTEKDNILTEDDIEELKKRVDDVLKENGLILKTVYQSDELQKIIKECVEKTIAGDRDTASTTAEQIVKLMKRIDENDKAYRDLVGAYDAYKAEMSEKLRQLKEETSGIINSKADREGISKELEKLAKEIESVSGLTSRFEKETEKRISGLDTNILTNKEDFDSFVNVYNEYKTSVKEILETKAAKSDIEALNAQADALESSLKKSIEENEKLIRQNADDIASISSSLSGKKIWVGTQEQYNAIDPKDPDTLYFIK